MTDRDRRAASIAEAEWRFTAAECRLLLAMRSRARDEDPSGHAPVGSLIDDLAQAADRLRATVSSRPLLRGTEASAGQDPDPEEPCDRRDRGRNGSFTKPLQIDGR